MQISDVNYQATYQIVQTVQTVESGKKCLNLKLAHALRLMRLKLLTSGITQGCLQCCPQTRLTSVA